jgi:hypothetical protein
VIPPFGPRVPNLRTSTWLAHWYCHLDFANSCLFSQYHLLSYYFTTTSTWEPLTAKGMPGPRLVVQPRCCGK